MPQGESESSPRRSGSRPGVAQDPRSGRGGTSQDLTTIRTPLLPVRPHRQGASGNETRDLEDLPLLTTPPRISRLGLLTLTAITGTVYAGTIHVPGDFQSLNDAVQAAQSGDEIIVAAGEHPAGIRISKSITVRSEAGPEETVLRGTGDGPVMQIEADTDGGATLLGFTLTNGSGHNGGGLFLSGDVAVIDCTVTGNSADNGGGAFLVGSPVLSDVRFYNNQAENGGAIFLAPDATAILDVCDFFDNSAVSGGAVYISPRGSRTTFATIGAGSFDDNAATDGAAIYARMSGFDIVEASFTGNYAANRGGAIYTADSEFSSVASVTISNGEANEGGAIYLDGFGEFRIQDSEISGNSASDWDAAVSVTEGYELAMQGSAVWGNSPAAVLGVWDDLGSNSFVAPQRCAIDYAAPQGVVDMSDLMAFVDLFTMRDPAADLAAPVGMHDLGDLLAFINLYFGGGCD